MKEIAYIRSCSFYDDSRATKEVKALLQAGYKVHIIGWDRDGKALDKCKSIFTGEIDYSFYCVPVDGNIGFKGALKLISFFMYVKETLRKKKDILCAVHACDLDGGLGAYRICKRHKIPLIYDIYDYYIDSHNITGLLGQIVEKQEIKIINHSHTTIICTEERKNQINKAKPSKVVVIHNSPDVDELPQVDTKYDYVYCGAFGSGRLLEEITDQYRNNDDLRFLFAGGGRYEDVVKQADGKYANFSFVGSVPYDEVIKLESESAVLSAIYNPNKRNHILCAPNKFYEGLALGKPLIVCKGTGIDKVVEKEQIGVAINYKADEFYKAIRTIISNRKEITEMGKRGRAIYEKKYKWSIMKQRLIDIYNHL